MTRFVVASLILGILLVGLLIGLFGQSTVGLLSWFCLSPFAFIFFGWSLRSAKLPFRLVSRQQAEILDQYSSRRRT